MNTIQDEYRAARAKAVTVLPIPSVSPDITVLVGELRNFTRQVVALAKEPKPVESPDKDDKELKDILREMKALNARVVSTMSQPTVPSSGGMTVVPAPIVNVAAPVVHIDAPAAHVVPRHWRLEVTSRDVPYGRIKTISIEAID